MNDLLNTLFLGRCKGCSNRNLSPIDFISKGRELRWMCSACWAHWLSCHDMIENKDSTFALSGLERGCLGSAARPVCTGTGYSAS